MANHGWVRRVRVRHWSAVGGALALVLVVSGCAATGTWTASAPLTKGSDHVAGFEDVSCVTASECLAVGTYRDGGVAKVMAQRWDGTQWTLLPDVPLPAGADLPGRSRLVVDCGAAQACVAALTVLVSGMATPVAAAWDGVGWTATALAATVTGSRVDDVSCASATSCVLVGNEGLTPTPGRSQFAQRWDGTSWSSIAAPLPSPENASPVDLRAALSCPTATFCALANGWTTYAATMGTAVELFDGTTWTNAPEIPLGGLFTTPAVLADIECASPTWCVGTGFRMGGTAIVGFDGAAWHDQSPFLGFVLPTVSCAGAGRCLAVHRTTDASSEDQPVGGYALTAVGQGWGSTTAPAAEGARKVTGVSCAAGSGTATVCTVVGSTTTSDASGTTVTPLALHYQL